MDFAINTDTDTDERERERERERDRIHITRSAPVTCRMRTHMQYANTYVQRQGERPRAYPYS